MKLDEKALQEYMELVDPERINQQFVVPFTGMKETYALQKGLEIGIELGARWQASQDIKPTGSPVIRVATDQEIGAGE
jgi:hypothetical protein